MSKHSRQALTLLVISALGVSTAVSIAQTNDTATSSARIPAAPEVERAPAVATDNSSRAQPVHFKGRSFGHRGRGNAMMQFFDEIDADNDGSVTQIEVDQFLATQLTEGDTDGNGSVGLEEFQVIYFERTHPQMVDAFQDLDDDGDGQVTSAELSNRFGTIVERMDRNGDDTLSADDRRRGDRGGRRGRGHGRDGR